MKSQIPEKKITCHHPKQTFPAVLSCVLGRPVTAEAAGACGVERCSSTDLVNYIFIYIYIEIDI